MRGQVDSGLGARRAGLAAGMALGIPVNFGPCGALHGTPGYMVNVFWNLFNIAVLTIACSVLHRFAEAAPG